MPFIENSTWDAVLSPASAAKSLPQDPGDWSAHPATTHLAWQQILCALK